MLLCAKMQHNSIRKKRVYSGSRTQPLILSHDLQPPFSYFVAIFHFCCLLISAVCFRFPPALSFPCWKTTKMKEMEPSACRFRRLWSRGSRGGYIRTAVSYHCNPFPHPRSTQTVFPVVSNPTPTGISMINTTAPQYPFLLVHENKGLYKCYHCHIFMSSPPSFPALHSFL